MVARLLLGAIFCACAVAQNRPPRFERGGDMLDFILDEATSPGTVVYTVLASDEDGDKITYSISGDHFSVDRDTGEVTLVKAVDRERMRFVEVILTITDVAEEGREPNLVSVRRLVPIKDANDNPPVFNGLDNGAYRFSVTETSEVGSTVFSKVNVTDDDFGKNGEVSLVCDSSKSPDTCDIFDVRGVGLNSGVFIGIVTLRAPLDFEKIKNYDVSVLAMDGGERQLTASARMMISVEDVQDQPPEFVNGPFSATVAENTAPGTPVLDIVSRDGDTGIPRELKLSIVGDQQGFFQLEPPVRGSNGVYRTRILTGNVTLDREDPAILRDVGLYQFKLLAEEVAPDRSAVAEKVTSDVTIVVTDQDDQLPKFNKNEFLVFIPEDTADGTPLPGLDMVVSDSDEGQGARFSLRLDDVQNSKGVFRIFPTEADGRAPVLITVADSSRLNYERDSDRQFAFHVVASQREVEVTAKVTVLVTDSNDHPPEFAKDTFTFSVAEDATAGHVLGMVTASDRDSGQLGAVQYRLRGFEAEKFRVNKTTGELSVADCPFTQCLDYEEQKRYSLTISARDGGNRTSSAALIIEIGDVNDNRPMFVEHEYSRTLEDGAREFFPSFFVEAKDADNNGISDITYAIIEGNWNDTFSIDVKSGQITANRPLVHNDTVTGRYDLVVEATDGGEPLMKGNVRVFITVGRDSNEAPVFRASPYMTTITESASPGDVILRLSAHDSDGEDHLLGYYIQDGAADNFEVNDRGEISVSQGALLDLEMGGASEYQLLIHAVDAGRPPKTGVAEVVVKVEDINDSPPEFEPRTYVEYVPENSEVGRKIATLLARDLDTTADLRYQLLQPISARDRAGVPVPTNQSDFTQWLAVNANSGELRVNASLDHSIAAVLMGQVRVTDGSTTVGRRFDVADFTVFIQAFSDNNPVFDPPWLPNHPTIDVQLPEEGQPGSTIYTLKARDPVSGLAVKRYEEIAGSDPEDWFSVDEGVGEVMINRRLDFDTMSNKSLSLRVRAVSGQRSSQALVHVHLVDINDNSPLFSQKSYDIEVSEESYYPTPIGQFSARDIDSEQGFGNVSFSLQGTTANQFYVDAISGQLTVAPGVRLDRETTPVHVLRVVAQDNPNAGEMPNKSYAQLTVRVLDANDNLPRFSADSYTAVVAENAPLGTGVITVHASDKDAGNSGTVRYSIVDAGATDGLFDLDPVSGDLTVKADLSGKGRIAPYRLSIRAQDEGADPLLSDVPLSVYIGDVSSNDGIPRFERPTPDEVVNVLENLPPGALVIHARATDPDDPLTPSGDLRYSFLGGQLTSQDGNFVIDERTGIVRTRASLDREQTATYRLLLQASDRGRPPQQTLRALVVRVSDVDDNRPTFHRSVSAAPLEVVVNEEMSIGSLVTTVEAHDEDGGQFGNVHYAITAGDPKGVFAFNTTSEKLGQLIIASRLDREERGDYLLTVQCLSERPAAPRRSVYDPQDLSMIQLRIQVLDIDDNPPIFSRGNFTTGVKVDAPVRTLVATLSARDPDQSPAPVRYSISDVTFSRRLRSADRAEVVSGLRSFVVDDVTGQIWTNEVLAKYSGGYFDLLAEAASADDPSSKSEAVIRVFVLKPSELRQFVFARAPGDVKPELGRFSQALEAAVPAPVSVHIYQAEYYSRPDGRVDFTSTGSCFQVVSDSDIYTGDEAAALLDTAANAKVAALFTEYGVDSIEPCVYLPGGAGYQFGAAESLVLAVAGVILLGALTALVVLTWQWSRYRRARRRRVRRYAVQEVTVPAPMVAPPSSLPPGSRAPSIGPDPNYSFPQGSIDGAMYSTVPA